jgi:hypothetical protein
MANNKMQLEGQSFRGIKRIPLEIAWAAGTPSIAWNPENEDISLTDNGAGDVTVTFANASLAPLKLLGHSIQVADANTLSLEANIDGAPSTTVLKMVINSGADGATETDAVSLFLDIAKTVAF